MQKRIFLSAPHMSGNEQKYIAEVFESNYIAPLGAFVDRFEAMIIAETKVKHALAVSSGTAAIHLALRVLGIQAGDEVLASTFTFIGSVSPILYQGAHPVFIDSEKESWNLSPKLLEAYLKSAQKMPKALIVTHLYGQSANIESIAQICKKYGVYLIEDAAEALGASYNGQALGSFGDFGIYSFNGNKILTTSGGGMLVSDNQAWIEKAKFYATQAREAGVEYQHKEYGYNYRMSNVLAAIGVAQMEVLKKRIAQKRAIFEHYKSALKGVVGIRFMEELPNSFGNRWLTTLLFEHSDIYAIIEALERIDVESRPLWRPMHMQELFKDAKHYLDGTSEQLFKQGLCLASSTTMTPSDIEKICDTIKAHM